MTELNDPGAFHRRFEKWAGRVRRRLLLARALTGASLGFAGAALLAAAFWYQRLGPWRPWAAALGGLGLVLGIGWGLRKRWNDTEVALYLDGRLDANEAIATAVELRGEAERNDAAREVVVRDANDVLSKGDAKRVRPRVLRPVHGLAPVGGAALAWVCLIPLPAAPPVPPPPPGAELVKLEDIKGLSKIEALEKLSPKDAEQERRLKQIAKDARKLREDLAKGLEKREAQARIARLRDDIAAERDHLGDQKNRQGLEAAVNQLKKNKSTAKAAEALGNGDLVQFDEEMRKLANLAESESRDDAKKALEEAAKAARKQGAEDVARALEEQQKQFAKREAQGQALRELGKALKQQGKLSEEAQRDLEEFGQSGSPEAQKRLAESMEKALEGMSEAERKQLAENLKKRMEEQNKSGAANPMTQEQIDEMAKRLGTPEGQEALRKQLEELAKPPQSDGSKRQQGLNDADRGGAEAQRQLGAPMPMQGQDSPPSGGDPGKQPGNGKGQKPGKGSQAGGTGSHKDEGEGDHKGQTDKVQGKELRSKAQARINPGAPMHGSSQGRAPARAGETANRAGSGALGQVGPGEVSAVERSEVPDEYREQVGRYFEP